MATKPDEKMTLERLATLVVEHVDFATGKLRDELRGEFRQNIAELREHMDAKFFAVHNRIDDLVDTRAKRDDLAAANVRVTRIEGHLGLA